MAILGCYRNGMDAASADAPDDLPLDWSRVDTVLLDMDGTVLDLAFDNYFWTELLPQRYAERRGVSVDAGLAELAPRLAAVEHTLAWYSLDYWSQLTGLNLAELTLQVRERIVPLPGSVDFLHAVRASGRPLWLVTNAHRDSWQPKLEQTGIGPLFDRIVSSHDHGAAKEDAAFWTRLQQAHPFERARALFVDDNLRVLRAAEAHGIGQILAIRRPDSRRPARNCPGFAAIDGLHCLLPLLARHR